MTDLLSEFGEANIEEKENGLNNLVGACKRILDIHAPRKLKYARGNHMPFMNKALSKEIMTRTPLRNKFLKDRCEENKKRYSKQRNYCVSLLRKSKLDYFGNLNSTGGASNRSFYPIFNKSFDHLETLLTIRRPKKGLPAGSLRGSLVPIP